ncbi:MAG: FtsX-like permease family protein [Clostridia bacterium]|nr:FtsX-like permease family protein [Clostridia bacterium]
MKRLNIKMIRDIRKNLSQFITIFLMVMIGVMAYSGIESYMDGMTETANKFYSENNLQDLNVIGANFTKEDLDNIKSLNNVKDAERKLSVTGITDNDKTLLLNFIESNNISKFYIIEGEQFDSSKSGVWLDNFYAIENNIKVGDIILVKFEGMELHEKVLGLINVPDHLYDVRDESELYPDRKEFGFAYVSTNEIPDNVIFNSIMVDVDDTSKTNEVKNEIEDKIENAKAIVNIEDTPSYVTYQGEIDEGKTYVGVFSGLFLFIAMLSVITTMTRVVKNQRIQIGTLKALGFSDRKIIIHYIGYGFWISIIASIVGLILGYFIIGKIFIGLEMAFFEIPNGHPALNMQCYITALCVVLVVSLITYITGRKILKENPAETLRNKIPNVKAKSINITTKGIFKKLGFSSKWNLRDIIRNKMRTFMGIAGVVGCSMLIVCAIGMLDSMNFFVKLQFETIYNFDYKLNIKENISEVDLTDLYAKYGKSTSESLGIEIKDDKGDRESNNIFVTDAEDYVRFVDRKNKIISKPNNDGIYVTYKLAETKGYKLGDEITWHIYGDDTYYTSKIIGFNKDPQNQNLTMTRKYLESLGIEYKPNALYTNSDLSNVKEINGIDTIQDIESLKEGMTGMLSMMKTMLILIIGVAVLLGGVIIYNLGILSYTEKQYQFATLKVLGFNDKKIKNIFIKQNNWIAIISIVIGLPLGYYLTDWLFKTAIEEHYDFGAYILPQTYIIAAVGTFVVSYLVSKFLARKIKSIDMVSSLKGNE